MEKAESVNDCLLFSKKRLEEFKSLNNGDVSGTDPKFRQQLLREFFFHLVIAIELLTQAINIARKIYIDAEDVSVKNVILKLDPNDPVRIILDKLHPKTRFEKIPRDPYSEEGCHFRILLYRNIIAHEMNFPFRFNLDVQSGKRTFNLLLDPRDKDTIASIKPGIEEMNYFWQLVNDKCQNIIALLPQDQPSNGLNGSAVFCLSSLFLLMYSLIMVR